RVGVLPSQIRIDAFVVDTCSPSKADRAKVALETFPGFGLGFQIDLALAPVLPFERLGSQIGSGESLCLGLLFEGRVGRFTELDDECSSHGSMSLRSNSSTGRG